MKTLSAALFALLLFGAGVVHAQKSGAQPLIKSRAAAHDVSVKVSYQPAPVVKFDGYQSRSSKGKSARTEPRWLEIECKFLTPAPGEKDAAAEPYFDELTFKYDVLLYETRAVKGSLINAKKESTAGKNPPAVFSGEESYVNVMRDEDEHSVIAFIPPSQLNAYLNPSVYGKKAEDLYAVIVSVYYKGKIIGGGCYIPKSLKKEITAGVKGADADKKGMIQTVKKLTENPNTFKALESIRRRGTPYEHLNHETYEHLKPLPLQKVTTGSESETTAPADDK